MLSQIYYLLRSQVDGSYISANPNPDEAVKFLLLFREDFDAHSYLNTHAPDVSDRFAIESISATQLKTILKRWGFQGVGIIQDPLLPNIEFLIVS
ncbi:MAG: hypothetical protein F6K25_06365 [Okeania sp. SIO2G4]|uniref:hypothetical protein n=1 Tax=unclassified Okeania TaxID=2634635 RepID=UPI0013B68983|nr:MULTISPECIES: hypothetical protein [unclassified Okeania]NEP03477.1 hypothetical protein [Okeania sp. SIO4D6]NEP38178.1 hypothetical protein [Okeania sp. SIO2H7]NEP70474.1 hypothetical protein [Okeania sp. SIO2G5]NEP92676.1 hypothetical protein [Okeania sp. SIO2F5]NEQ90366.1 hypothetical protein [Okeania sp. SIO2G4]